MAGRPRFVKAFLKSICPMLEHCFRLPRLLATSDVASGTWGCATAHQFAHSRTAGLVHVSAVRSGSATQRGHTALEPLLSRTRSIGSLQGAVFRSLVSHGWLQRLGTSTIASSRCS